VPRRRLPARRVRNRRGGSPGRPRWRRARGGPERVVARQVLATERENPLVLAHDPDGGSSEEPHRDDASDDDEQDEHEASLPAAARAGIRGLCDPRCGDLRRRDERRHASGVGRCSRIALGRGLRQRRRPVPAGCGARAEALPRGRAGGTR
jgi:hypothetical protein